jgi:hypothetical protein
VQLRLKLIEGYGGKGEPYHPATHDENTLVACVKIALQGVADHGGDEYLETLCEIIGKAAGEDKDVQGKVQRVKRILTKFRTEQGQKADQ